MRVMGYIHTNSLVVNVQKKDWLNQVFVDYRKLNCVCKFDPEPMDDPDFQNVHKRLSFQCPNNVTKIDLSGIGFWHIQNLS